MIDFMSVLGLPVVVVARSTLGTINHTLLTLEALRARALAIAGVVLVGPANVDNRLAIEAHGRTTVIGELPWLDPVTPTSLQEASAEIAPGAMLDWAFA